jgi:catechol 2,3-dioxygenase-like lactoylglutathione lyase family enzyme
MNPFRLFVFCLALVAPVVAQGGSGSGAAPRRPRITGISHAAFYVSDMAKARAFYEGFLGYQSPFSIPRKNPQEQLVWIKINDRQSVELFPGSEVAPDAERMYHFAIETDDAEAMRLYLQSKGVEVPPKTAIGKIGNKNYFVKDPQGNIVEIVEYLPDGWTMREKGKFLPETRVSQRMSHVGVMIAQLDDALKFYRDILGFREIWRGSKTANMLSWVNLQVPDGNDYVEFMLYDKYPTLDRVHTLQHICLEVPDVAKVGEMLRTRELPAGSKPATAMATGVNGKRQINYYDPDGTRVEVMEPGTADGKPRPPSTAPAPHGEPKPATAEKMKAGDRRQ